jgi:hypothetical protein
VSVSADGGLLKFKGGPWKIICFNVLCLSTNNCIKIEFNTPRRFTIVFRAQVFELEASF